MDLYKNIYQYTKSFPKGDRYNIGSELKQLNILIIELFIEAESTKKDWKLPILEKASIKLSLLKLLVRVAYEIKIIDPKKHLLLQDQLQEIGRMLGGWIKTVK